MIRETCRQFLRSTSDSLALSELPAKPIAVPLPVNIGPEKSSEERSQERSEESSQERSQERSEESSEERSEELLISSLPGSGHGNFPGHHKPFPIPGFPGHIGPFPFPDFRPPRPAHHAAPETVQQVFVEQSESHRPNIGQIFPEKWPENLVAAFVPADWLADHVQINQDSEAEEEVEGPTDLPEVVDGGIDAEDNYDEYYESE